MFYFVIRPAYSSIRSSTLIMTESDCNVNPAHLVIEYYEIRRHTPRNLHPKSPPKSIFPVPHSSPPLRCSVSWRLGDDRPFGPQVCAFYGVELLHSRILRGCLRERSHGCCYRRPKRESGRLCMRSHILPMHSKPWKLSGYGGRDRWRFGLASKLNSIAVGI